jgi:hypothetical protein
MLSRFGRSLAQGARHPRNGVAPGGVASQLLIARQPGRAADSQE